MNAEMIFNEFAKYAETNRDYYTFGKHGIIEDVLAFMGLPSKKFLGASSAVHADNLETLHNFLISQASDEQRMYTISPKAIGSYQQSHHSLTVAEKFLYQCQ